MVPNITKIWPWFGFQLPQRPGAGAIWEAFQMFRTYFLGCLCYLAMNTLFWAEIDALHYVEVLY